MLEDTISPAQLRLLHVLFRDVERTDRLYRISLIVSRRIHTTLALTKGEATTVIDTISREQETPIWTT